MPHRLPFYLCVGLNYIDEMVLSHLYSAILRGKWFIRLEDVEASALLLQQVLDSSSSKSAEEKLSDRKPLKLQMAQMTSSKSQSEMPDNAVAIIPLHGTMLKYGTYCAYGTVEIAELIREAANNPKVGGVLLDVDSGGGAVDAIAPILDALEYNRSVGKSSVALCDLAASAAYYAALGCDEIVANNQISAEFGSIGVMMSFPDYAKYYENAGIKIHTIYSNLSDYKNAPFEAAKKGEYDKIKAEELDPLALKFQEAVKNKRGEKLVLDTEGILSGRMFYDNDALACGLIDAVGNRDFAVSRVRSIRVDATINDYVKSKL